MIKKYLEHISQTMEHQDQREESYYPAIATLFTDFANSINRHKISITILPKKTEAGNPDFRVWDGNNKIVGYIEAKIPGTDLNKIEISEQLKRYLETFPNVILTDFYEFRLYRNGELIKKVSISQPNINKIKSKISIEQTPDFEQLLDKFYDFSLPKIFSAESLAIELAKRTRFLRDEIISVELRNEDKKNYIRGFYNAFQKYLITGLSESEFADLYSQTITYGMFTAKIRSKQEDEFNRRNAISYIPPTIGILRDIFEFISLGKLTQQMEVIIDDIAEVLSVSDATKLLNDYYKQGKGTDPIIHFYETFLHKYDPSTQEKRGVYYTPESVVKYIVNSIDEILIQDFKKIGFADTSIKVLDPAGGTLTFLAEATKKAINTFIEYYGEGDKNGFIKRHILKNFFGFELMMAPYAIAHLKMSYLLQEHDYTLESTDRFQLYLTNTLDAKLVDIPELPGLASLADEASEANIIKKKTPILAIIGNPPYSIASYNKSEFETEIMKLYKEDVKDQKNIQILSDDYIKFIRYSHWKIENSGGGVVGLITKNTYLNIAAAKGMRKHLLLTFDKIYILNLHGKLYEKTPDGGKDQNVFDIRVGTAIMFLIKTNSIRKNTYAKLYYKDLFGDQNYKWDYLTNNKLQTSFTSEDEIEINEDHFFFEKKNFVNHELYNSFWAIDEIFDKNNSGVETGRDHFILADTKQELKNRLNKFINSNLPLDELRKTFELQDQPNFKLLKVKQIFKEIDDNKFHSYHHKPFYIRNIYYEKFLLRRNSEVIMNNFINADCIGFILKKRYADKFYSHCFVTENITDRNFLGGQSYIFPLWENKVKKETELHFFDKEKRKSNLKKDFEGLLETTYSMQNITEKIFYYTYAVLYSNTYRTNFSKQLQIGFPKIPFTSNISIFEELSKFGKELAELHLLKSDKLSKPQVKFQGNGDGKINKLKYNEKENIISINDSQYFDNINKNLWEYEIGKNKIIQQWIKRKNNINFEDAVEFGKIATAIYETFKIQNEIDLLYPEILNELIENI